MTNVSKLTLIGNVGQDPKLRDVNGKKVAEVSIAINDPTMLNGVKTENTTWYRVSMWRAS